MSSYFDFMERKHGSRRSYLPSDVVEFPAMCVTEEPATDDSMRRYLSAEERLALTLTPFSAPEESQP